MTLEVKQPYSVHSIGECIHNKTKQGRFTCHKPSYLNSVTVYARNKTYHAKQLSLPLKVYEPRHDENGHLVEIILYHRRNLFTPIDTEYL